MTIHPVSKGGLSGTIPIPGSKSHTIRTLLIAAMAEGQSSIYNPLFSQDTEACITACRAFGADIEVKDDTIIVNGTGGSILFQKNVIDVGNSGTTLYLSAALASLSKEEIILTGDDQIRSRPILPLIQSLRDLGASVKDIKNNGCAPIIIKGPLLGGKTSIECPTSQYLSALLLAAPLISKTDTKTNLENKTPNKEESNNNPHTEITVPLLYEKPYVEMTLSYLEKQKINISKKELDWFYIPGNQKYKQFPSSVPGDFSSATFFLCAAAITRSTLTLQGLDMSDTQGDKEVVTILQKMGCQVEFETSQDGKESYITISCSELHGGDFDLNAIPDALPALAVTACYASGTTKLLNVPQARLKETDRITVMATELTKMGADIEELPDGLIVHSTVHSTTSIIPNQLSALKGAPVKGHHDHRVIMALAIAALGAEGPVKIDDTAAAAITFPDFFYLLEKCKNSNKNT